MRARASPQQPNITDNYLESVENTAIIEPFWGLPANPQELRSSLLFPRTAIGPGSPFANITKNSSKSCPFLHLDFD
jgi:hypothetical protein